MARSGVIYGNSGTFKTTAVKHFARYIYEVTGKSTLLLSMDGGGWDPMNPEIGAGIVLPYRCNNEVPLPVIRKISQGYFPENPRETDIARTNLKKINWEQFGGFAVEGLTSISQAIMRHLADKGIKTGEEATNQFGQQVMVEGKIEVEKFAGNSRGHYGFVQNAIYSMVMAFNALPCHYVLFTALESRTEEDDRSTVYGPQIAGKKATNLVASWLGDCVHSEAYPVEKPTKVPDPKAPGKMMDATIVESEVRSYFVKHPDPVTGIMFPAKPRVTPEQMGALMELYPGGYFSPTAKDGFDSYLHNIDRLTSAQTDEAARWRAEQDAKRAARMQAPAPVVATK